MQRSLIICRFRPDCCSSGAGIRNSQNIRALGRMGPVDVFSINENEENVGPLDGIREWRHFKLTSKRSANTRSIRTRLSGLFHSGTRKYFVTDIRQWLDERVSAHAYDLVVFEELAVTAYMTICRGRVATMVYDAHNVEAVLREEISTARYLKEDKQSLWRGFRKRLEDWKLFQAECNAVTLSDKVWTCSAKDAELIRRIYGHDATVVPNGVDVGASDRVVENRILTEEFPAGSIRILFVGSFGYFPNEDAALVLADKVVSELLRRGRRVELVLVGRDPTASMLKAASARPGVIRVTGEVDDIRPYYEKPCVACFPLRYGSGTRLKILEAFSVGRVVVTTSKGAEGIEGEDGRHLLIREDPDSIAEAIISLWDCDDLRRNLSKRAYELVRSEYSWDAAESSIRISLDNNH